MGELGRRTDAFELTAGIPPKKSRAPRWPTGSAESIQRQTGEEGITLEDVLAGR